MSYTPDTPLKILTHAPWVHRGKWQGKTPVQLIYACIVPELAWSLCDYADMLLERNNEGDRDKAMTLLDESLSTSTELGMRPLMERVLSRREILKA